MPGVTTRQRAEAWSVALRDPPLPRLSEASRSKATGGGGGQEPQERQRAPGALVAFPHSGLASSGAAFARLAVAALSASSSERAGLVALALGSPVWLQQKPGKHGCMRCRLGLPWWQSGQHLPAGAGDTEFDPWSGRSTYRKSS